MNNLSYVREKKKFFYLCVIYHSNTFKCLNGSKQFFCNKKCFNKAVGISMNRKYQYGSVMMSNDHQGRSPRNEHFANIMARTNKYLEISPSLSKTFCIQILCYVIHYAYKHKTNDSIELCQIYFYRFTLYTLLKCYHKKYNWLLKSI